MQHIKQIQKLVFIALNQDGVQNGRRKSAFSRLNIGCARSFIKTIQGKHDLERFLYTNMFVLVS